MIYHNDFIDKHSIPGSLIKETEVNWEDINYSEENLIQSLHVPVLHQSLEEAHRTCDKLSKNSMTGRFKVCTYCRNQECTRLKHISKTE